MYSKETKFLIVDDMAGMRRMVKNTLNELGFENISEATQGEEAVEILEEQPINIVISDFDMPGMNGLELLKWVRENDKEQEQKIFKLQL